jgi:CRP/FNR family transcriptional regulator
MEESVTNEILAHLSPLKAKKDNVILSPDIVSPGLYLIGKGRVKVFRLNSNGKELILHLLKDGDCFGEKSAMDGAPQGDFVTATTETSLFLLPREKLHDLLQKHPKLYPSVLRSICRWMDHLNGVIESISLSSARERVSVFLKRLVVEQESDLVSLPHKKHEVALMLGLRPETFSRALAEIEEQGAIKLNHRQIQVVDKNLL